VKYAQGIKNINSVSYAVTELGGINKRGNARNGALYSATDMSSRAFPYLCPRARRATVRKLSSPDGLHGDDTLAYVDGGRLYYGGLEISGLTLSDGEKDILKLGKYLLIFPDEVYFNTANESDFGAMSVGFTAQNGRVCCVDTQLNEITYAIVTKEPDGASVGDWCAIQGSDGALRLKRFDGYVWNEAETLLKLSASGIGASFRDGDTVECNGLDGISTGFRIVKRSEDALYFEGTVSAAVSLGAFGVSRTVPIFDCQTVSGGRLYGVRRGRDKSGNLVCRIYASAENDPLVFSGLGGGAMMDIDIAGAFTGICDYLGSAVAFSESDIVETRIKNGALIGTVIKGYGLESGAKRSIASAGGALYYKSSVGVCIYDGSYPERISDCLGGGVSVAEHGCPAIFASGKYYIKLNDRELGSAIYVYDTENGLWSRETDPGVKRFAKRRENVYALLESGELILLDSEQADENELTYCSGSGYPIIEEGFAWSFETAEIGSDNLKSVCPVRLALRLVKNKDSEVKIGVIYDGQTICGETVVGRETFGAVSVPIPLKRADTFRLRISGSGECVFKGFAVQYRAGGEAKAWR